MICATSCLHAQCMYACQQCWQTNTYSIVTIFSDTQPGSDVKKHVLSLSSLSLSLSVNIYIYVCVWDLRYLFHSTILSSYTWTSQKYSTKQYKTQIQSLQDEHIYVLTSSRFLQRPGSSKKNKQATHQMHPLCHREPGPARGPRPNLAAQSSLSSVPQSLTTRAGPRCLFDKFLLYFVGEENWGLIFARNDWGNTNW